MQKDTNMKNSLHRKVSLPYIRRLVAGAVFCGTLLTGMALGSFVFAQEQEASVTGGSDDLGLEGIEEPQADQPLPEPVVSQAAPPLTHDISLEQAPALPEENLTQPAENEQVSGMPPQPVKDSGGGSAADLPGIDIAVSPEETAAKPAQASTDEGFDKMLERKGKPESPTPDSVKQKIAEDDRSPFKPEKIRSLFFTYWQHEAIVDAKKSRGRARPPTESELKHLDKDEEKKPGERDLILDGIVFVSADDWTIWINGMRVTPSAIPKEVIDLRVFKEYIEVKWLDEHTNQVFPIRLRAHQRFNLDMRIFLPG